MQEPIQPPASFEQFTYAFDPALPALFPSPPPLPSSADLFSPSETTDLLGFLDNFSWDLEAEVNSAINLRSPEFQDHDMTPEASAPNMHTMTLQSALAMTMSEKGKEAAHAQEQPPSPPPQPARSQPARSTRASRRPSAATHASSSSTQSVSSADADGKPKQLLSTPQKRLNHIVSEQKRRNAIRDGYVQLTTLLAPAGAPPGAGMPTRGRPKGSGTRAGRGRGAGGFKGKSGILFRAVEYIHWLEEGRDALLDEVLKVEAAAGIHRI
ncbi:bHLHzip domain-containing protein [Phanerochaete sordida]|uniref:BHLHzip domain-containing protein n=1 Tax=Phanerochaete sordida TaxID=48140 RepID=A0A9P3G1I5_9APHY|nr:bHLHzip domain-containing protein [Phanerochaete sordida]